MQADASEERISKYELLRPLGSGGMGEVYLALDTRLRRQVAIKFVAASRVSDPEASARLLREARAAATLDHPGICAVYDVERDPQGRTCIVMQYVEGETLAARLTRGALPSAEALALAAGIADALAAAHAHGIVHRDLKPQNVMIGADGRPKLLDFGIAFTDVPAEAAAAVATRTATSAWTPDAIVGTPAYMSPEQVLRKPVEPRSDLFSLGAVLFECLTGTPAFQAATDIETWARVVYGTPPAPSAIDSRVPAAADAIVARLLAKDPEQRFQSAADVAIALRTSPLSVRRWSPRRAAIVAAAVAAVTLVGVGGWRLLRARPLPPPPAEAQDFYDRGLQYLRDGAYARAAKALTEAVSLHAQFPQALARLAEARNELDDESAAQDAVIRISDMTRAGVVLAKDDGVRVDAISALLENDLSRAEAGYRRLADDNPRDRGAWLDLARVRQAAGLRDEARQAAQHALKINPNDAAAHLRLASLAAEGLRREEAIGEFKEAERLYGFDSLTEGQAEAMLQQARFLDAIGAFTESQKVLADAEKFLALAESPYQQARATMLRSSLAASAGDLKGARQLAQNAVATAQAAGLDTVAAEALIQSGTTLAQLGDYDNACADLQRGIDLAKRSGAKREAVRGTLQLASAYIDLEQFTDARNLANGMLGFVRGRYPRFEMIALSIVARSQERSDPRAAGKLARQVLSMAKALHDDREVGTALDTLIATALVLGSLPEALDLRAELEPLHRQLHDTGNLASDLTGRADLLIRLGRFTDAEQPLHELEAGAAAGNQVFASRTRRVAFLRAVAASEARDFPLAIRYAEDVLARSASLKSPDTTQATAEALRTNAQASLGRRADVRPWSPAATRVVTRDVHYWRATALLASGDAAGVTAEVTAALADIGPKPSAEFEWRMTALAAVAARHHGDSATAAQMTARAQAALRLVRSAWRQDVTEYERRADLTALRRAAGLS